MRVAGEGGERRMRICKHVSTRQRCVSMKGRQFLLPRVPGYICLSLSVSVPLFRDSSDCQCLWAVCVCVYCRCACVSVCVVPLCTIRVCVCVGARACICPWRIRACAAMSLGPRSYIHTHFASVFLTGPPLVHTRVYARGSGAVRACLWL